MGLINHYLIASLGLFLFFLPACGGSKATEATITESASSGSTITPTTSADKPEDKQAAMAKTFCEHNIEKSLTQPPDDLSRKQIIACLTAIRSEYQAKCSKGIQRSVFLKIIVEKSGMISDAFPLGDSADSPEAKCIAEMVKQLAIFPQFKASNQQVIQKYKFELQP